MFPTIIILSWLSPPCLSAAFTTSCSSGLLPTALILFQPSVLPQNSRPAPFQSILVAVAKWTSDRNNSSTTAPVPIRKYTRRGAYQTLDSSS
ncbi:hypothetical protein BD311DRAFT_753873 [Dichomitus squalens]|uniref:Secreted protein n=1 Tax=Dichomitus squalens TaxID=114155 RepID=A0A4V2K0Z7_9APHY|nr:hypothetical protein BD311DRAFT_753873 [Dichomitus squalens]